MIFEEKTAKKMIEILLENDAEYYKQWLDNIRNFNSEQIENLLSGNLNFNYPVSKENIKDLIRKFDNFKLFTRQWYLKENYYKYLVPLWKHYICAEALKKFNPNKRAKILESKYIKYSEWPNEIKMEFNQLLDNSFITDIYKNKNKFNQRGPLKNIIKRLEKIKGKMTKEEEEKENKKSKKNNNIEEANQIINKDACFNILSHLRTFCTAFSLIDLMNNNNIVKNDDLDDIKNLYDNYLDFDFFDDNYDSSVISNESSSISKKLEAVHAALSLINLVESINNFCTIRKEIKTIEDNNHKKNIDEIVFNFNKHINEINFDFNFDHLDNYIKKVNSIIENIEDDQKKLIEELKLIETEIQSLSKHKENSKIGVGKSVALGALGFIGGITNGFSLIRSLATIANAVSGIFYGKSWYDCNETIKNLKELVTRINEEKAKFTNGINALSDKIKAKSITIPDYLEEVEKLLNNENN